MTVEAKTFPIFEGKKHRPHIFHQQYYSRHLQLELFPIRFPDLFDELNPPVISNLL